MAEVKGTFKFTVQLNDYDPMGIMAAYIHVADGQYFLKGDDHQILFSAPIGLVEHILRDDALVA